MTAPKHRLDGIDGDASETSTDRSSDDASKPADTTADRSADTTADTADDRSADTTADRSADTAADRPANRPHVLLLEDDDSLRKLLENKLESSGYETTALADGRECWSFLATGEPPDLVLLDVMVPGLDGFRVLGRIRNDDRLEGVPIIVLSSRGQQADVRRGFDLGAEDYVTKPFSPAALVAKVRSLLS
ncbi:response regulator transcription factor [Natronorubrum tibetense]|uniref:Response regulator receiver protein n=1 Tax=Natronorubrum tibetense GA33 TaxID=1114856 RepID=L9VXH4_9EURY|nr:response regulator transcription factor [Natronorubrum tibetense]ELY41879.1 response regulator receiver protein [Natronorubrum tibetense GA33]